MAKKNKSRNSKKVKQIEDEVMEEEPQEEMELGNKRVTLEEIDAMSDGEEDEIEEWNAEAKALRQAIADGAFDKLITKSPQNEDMEEVAEDGNSEEEEEDAEEQESEEAQEQEQQQKAKAAVGLRNMKALNSVTTDLLNAKSALPWAEKLDVIPNTPLPFGQLTEEGLPIHVHDDLKREVAFYNLALEAVHVARKLSENLSVPFSRPEDFFAEMVKTDDHMAKVKDRLIFEGKKMDAFEQRKSNKEQKLRAKEKHAHRLSEKAKTKKQHLRDVDDWATSAASNRAGGGKVRDDDNEYLSRMGPNKDRQFADKKYGHGGKKGRFKQNDPKSKNDMSGYNPKGNFAGGKKTTGTKRKGKRSDRKSVV